MKKLELIKVEDIDLDSNIYDEKYMEFDCLALEAIVEDYDKKYEDLEVKGFIEVDGEVVFVLISIIGEGELWSYDCKHDFVFSGEEELPAFAYIFLEEIDDFKRASL